MSNAVSVSLAESDVLQLATLVKHECHGVEFWQLPCTEIQTGESCAFVKHAVHILHLLGVEGTEVNVGDFSATLKHATHVGYLTGVEVG